MKIEMLTDVGTVDDTIDGVHVCVGVETECETVASCEECDAEASPETPIYVWTSANGINYFACAACLSVDDYARVLFEEMDVVIVLTHDNHVGYVGEIVFPANSRGKIGVRNPSGEITEATRTGLRASTFTERESYLERAAN